MTVKSVTGTAQRLVPGEKPKWVAIQAGEKLDELTVLRTGFRTRVVLAFADNSEVVVDRATKMGIAEFRKDGKVTRTRLGLKYGSMRANVHKARGPNDFTVKTAVAALAVLGTELKVKYYQKLQLQGITGVWNATSGHRQRQVKGTEKTDGKLTRSVQLTQMGRSTHLISFFGLGEADRRHLLHRGGGRGIFSFTQNAAGVLLNTPTPDNGSGGKIIVHE